MDDLKDNKPFSIVAASDRGSVRESNEDYFGLFDPETDELMIERGVLIVVTDGMGGHFSGAEASRTAVDVIGREYYSDGGESAVERFEYAFREANRQVFERVGLGRRGRAGTTCTAAVLFPDIIHIAHAGDSRAYVIKGGKMKQMTEDHSVVGDMMRKGILSKEEARKHPRRNAITRAVGLGSEVKVDIQKDIPFDSGDTVLLCSDGLFSMLDDGEIESITKENSPEMACEKLVRRAKEEGGKDNITVIVARKI